MSSSEENTNVQITIRMSSGTKFTITSPSSPSTCTIQQIKAVISNLEDSGKCPMDRQRLIHKGRILSDDGKSLEQYGILDSSHVLHLVKGSGSRPNASPSASASASANPTANPTANTNAGTNATSNANTAPSNNMNMNNLFGTTTPDMNNMSQFQNQLLSNPSLMSDLLNSPMMQSLTSNPSFFRSIIESNPQMRQLLENNPQLRHILDDPELMRQSMEMMRDPNAMQNAMRNQDLALSQIENLPGGFSALRRMYEDVQEPMMDALANNSGTSTSGGDRVQRSENANSGAAGTAMPNPWASNNNSNSGTSNRTSSGNTTTTNNNSNPWASFGNPSSSSGGLGDNMNDISNLTNMINSMNSFNNYTGNPQQHLPRPNIEQTIQLLENPMMQQMMNNLTSNPQLMQQMMDSNPMLRQLREQNPQLASMMSNPDVMRNMMNPDNLRGMMQMQNMMESMGMDMNMGMGAGSGGGMNTPFPMFGDSTTNPSTSSGIAGAGTGLDFSTLLNSMQPSNATRPTTNTAAANPIPPEQRFQIQLQSLNDMGFDDNRVNIAALMQTHGNVNRAVDILLTNPPAPYVDSVSNSGTVNVSNENAAAAVPDSSAESNSGNNIGDSSTDRDDNGEIVDKDKVDKKND